MPAAPSPPQVGAWAAPLRLPGGREPQHPRARDDFGRTIVAEEGAAAFVSEAESAGSAVVAAAINAAGGLLVVRGLGDMVHEPSLMGR